MNVSYQEQKELERKNQAQALVITLILNGLLFLLIWQVKIWNENPNPTTIQEPEGTKAEITFEQKVINPGPAKKQELPSKSEASVTPNTVPPLTSQVESPVTIKPSPPTPKVEVPEEPIVDLNLTLGKRSPKPGGAGNGIGTSGTGGNGLAGPNGNGGGSGGKGNGSGGYSEKPIAQNWTFPTSVISAIDNGSETGEITFFIRVNEKGSVTEIRIEKTNVKLSLAEKYKKAIKGARFTPKDDGKREGASGLKTIRIVPTN